MTGRGDFDVIERARAEITPPQLRLLGEINRRYVALLALGRREAPYGFRWRTVTGTSPGRNTVEALIRLCLVSIHPKSRAVRLTEYGAHLLAHPDDQPPR